MNNIELVKFAEDKLGTNYVYGMKGRILTEEKYNWLFNKYGAANVWPSDKKKVGTICTDCSGLISWATGYERNSTGYHDAADELHDIKTIADAPIGALCWYRGHIAIYAGHNEVIEARGSAYGVVRSNLFDRCFTHWFLCPDITYIEETPTADLGPWFLGAGPFETREAAEAAAKKIGDASIYRRE